jgi:UDP-N-acetylglucosamine 2-epimerase
MPDFKHQSHFSTWLGVHCYLIGKLRTSPHCKQHNTQSITKRGTHDAAAETRKQQAIRKTAPPADKQLSCTNERTPAVVLVHGDRYTPAMS